MLDMQTAGRSPLMTGTMSRTSLRPCLLRTSTMSVMRSFLRPSRHRTVASTSSWSVLALRSKRKLSPENLRARSAPPQPVVADPLTIAPPAVEGRPHALRMPRNHHGCQQRQRAGYHDHVVAVPCALIRAPAGANRALQLIDDRGCASESDVSETGAADPAKDGAPEVLPLAMIPSHWLFRRAQVGVFPVMGQLARVAYYVDF